MLGSSKQSWFSQNLSKTNYYWYNVGYGKYPTGSSQPYYPEDSGFTTLPAGGLVQYGQIFNANAAVTGTSTVGGLTIFNKRGPVITYLNSNITTNGTSILAADTTSNGLIWALQGAGNDGNQYASLAKFNPDGSNVWSYNITGFNLGSSNAHTIGSSSHFKVTNSGNIIVATPLDGASGTTTANVIVSMTQTPTINWANKLSGVGPGQGIGGGNQGGFTVDSSGNIYAVYYINALTYLIKLDSGGNIVWQKQLINSGGSGGSIYLSTDSYGNINISWLLDSGGNTYIMQVSSTGSINWQYTIRNNDAGFQIFYPGFISTDTTGNILLTGSASTSNFIGVPLIKLDTYGTLLFSNYLYIARPDAGSSSDLFDPVGPAQITSNVMYASAFEQKPATYSYNWNFALPPNGSYTGNTWVNGFTGNTVSYIGLSNVSLVSTSNITTSTGNITSSSVTGSYTIGSSITYNYVNQPMAANLNSLGSSIQPTPTPPGPYSASYLLVAGGGAGGSMPGNQGGGGGGGAGGMLTGTTTLTPGTTYSFTVGSGGIATSNSDGGSGGNSTGFSLTAVGGGGGGGQEQHHAGLAGGSGGGGCWTGGAGGAGTSGQGSNGGSGSSQGTYEGSGGGGAGGVGGSYTGGSTGYGGVGLQSSITGVATYYAGGGSGNGASGGNGGGGNGGNPGTNGTNGLGGGGGGAANNASARMGGNGGSGVVIISVPTANYTGTYTGAPTITTYGSNTILKFTASSGSYTA